MESQVKCMFRKTVEWRNVNIKVSPEQGLEPWTLRLKVWCSTDWAIRALLLLIFIHLTCRVEARDDEGALSDGTVPQRTRSSFQMIQSTKSELGIPSKKHIVQDLVAQRYRVWLQIRRLCVQVTSWSGLSCVHYYLLSLHSKVNESAHEPMWLYINHQTNAV